MLAWLACRGLYRQCRCCVISTGSLSALAVLWGVLPHAFLRGVVRWSKALINEGVLPAAWGFKNGSHATGWQALQGCEEQRLQRVLRLALGLALKIRSVNGSQCSEQREMPVEDGGHCSPC